MLAAPGDWTNILYRVLAERFDVDAVVLEQPISRFFLLRRRVARIGWRRALDQVVFSLVVVPWLRLRARSRIAELRQRLDADRPVPEERIIRVSSVNAAESRDALRRLSPRVVVVSGTRIVTDDVLDSVPAPFINMHAGITPRYRGVHGAYWAMAEGRGASAGVTVHLVDRGVDTGAILAQATIHPQPQDSFLTYPYLQIEAGLDLVVRAVEDGLAGRLVAVPSIDATRSVLRYHPGALEYLLRRIRAGVR